MKKFGFLKIKRYRKVALIIIILICLAFITQNSVILYKKENYSKGKSKNDNLLSYTIYDNSNENKIKMLITIRNENGIEYVVYPNEEKLECNGKTVICIDYQARKDEENIFKIKAINGEEKEEKIYANHDSIKNNSVWINCVASNLGYKEIEIDKKIELDGYEVYYKIGENSDWVKGTGKMSIFDYDLIQNGLINDDNTITIFAKVENKNNGNNVILKEKYEVDTKISKSNIKAESILDAMERYEFDTGEYKLTVKDEEYNLKVYSIDGTQEFNVDTTIGTEYDVANEKEEAKNMIVLKINGDLTINNASKITAYASKDGYGGPKGLMIYCKGTLTNNGTISMTARGAKAEGQNVYLWKNMDDTYEFVPKVGGIGGTYFCKQYHGKVESTLAQNGIEVSHRATGGGASGIGFNNGSVYNGQSGSGGNGTSYSGGAGGGSAFSNGKSLTMASNIGGAGGNAECNDTISVGGGAGNPGGYGANSSGMIKNPEVRGKNGTGGLLIIYANSIINNGNIIANGSQGGVASVGGGASGGGTINIFFKDEVLKGNIEAAGGIRANTGLAGANGTVSIGSIISGNYTE